MFLGQVIQDVFEKTYLGQDVFEEEDVLNKEFNFMVTKVT